MSRGLGSVQSFVLGVAGRESENRWLSIADIVAEFAESRQAGSAPPTASDLEVIRRAVRTLEARGLLRCEPLPVRTHRRVGRVLLESRKALSVVQSESGNPPRDIANQRYAELQRLLRDGAAECQEGGSG